MTDSSRIALIASICVNVFVIGAVGGGAILWLHRSQSAPPAASAPVSATAMVPAPAPPPRVVATVKAPPPTPQPAPRASAAPAPSPPPVAAPVAPTPPMVAPGLAAAAVGLPPARQRAFRLALRKARTELAPTAAAAEAARADVSRLLAQPQLDRPGIQAALVRARQADMAQRQRVEAVVVNFAAGLTPEQRVLFVQQLGGTAPAGGFKIKPPARQQNQPAPATDSASAAR